MRRRPILSTSNWNGDSFVALFDFKPLSDADGHIALRIVGRHPSAADLRAASPQGPGRAQKRSISIPAHLPDSTAPGNSPAASPKAADRLWVPHVRYRIDCSNRHCSVTDYYAWAGEDSRDRLAEPPVCGLSVYEDVDLDAAVSVGTR